MKNENCSDKTKRYRVQDAEEYARKSGKSIKEVVHEAILKFITKISPEDSIFTQPPAASKTGKHEKTSEQHDKILYGVN